MTEIIKSGTFDTHLSRINGQRDIYQEMLQHKRSPQTKRAYAADVKDFFGYFGAEPSPAAMKEFLSLSKVEATALVLQWRNHLTERGLKESSIGRKIGSIKALVKFSNDIGCCEWVLTAEALSCTRGVVSYRDTTGLPPDEIKKILSHPDRSTFAGKRDYAMLQLLWGNGLRRSEVVSLDLDDVDFSDRSLWVLGKGKSEKIRVQMNKSVASAVKEWLKVRVNYYEHKDKNALFICIGGIKRGARLTAQSLYNLVDRTSKAVGITKKMSPHRVRHSAITTVLERNNGNLRKAQSFSRHSDVNTLMVYDDNRNFAQSEMSDLLEF
ncbi:MAG: tyrosine-type recombinase/integrase [Okeania sp. SIO3H1]|nr:tyrosine-type recombinase/integrase [Okeania sp. SIO3H1]